MELKFSQWISGILMFERYLKCLLKTNLISTFDDFIFIIRCRKTFVLITLAFTWVAFAIGAIAWWGPRFFQLSHILHDSKEDKDVKAK